MTAPVPPTKATRLYWLGRYAQRAVQVVATSPGLVDPTVEGSLRFNLDRAYENGFHLRDILDTATFAHLRLALSRCQILVPGDLLAYEGVRDAVFAFWGMADETLGTEPLDLCRWGRFLEVWASLRGTDERRGAEAWKRLTAVWTSLGVAAPTAEWEAVQGWFGECYDHV